MKSKATRPERPAVTVATAREFGLTAKVLLLGAAALVLAFIVYSPALNGPFLFDDTGLLFALPGFSAPLKVWLTNVRPVLYFTYWMNAQVSGSDPYSYHVANVLIHVLASAMIFLIVRRLLEWSDAPEPRRGLAALFCGGIFLLHPIQSEAVGYLAGRSESLSVALAMAAYAVFLYRKDVAVGWVTVAAVLLLLGAAALSKEQVIAIPALLLLTDYWFNPGFSFQGIRGNWKLYGTMAVGAVLALWRLIPLIMSAETAGFGMKDVTWYQYFFTQCRALFVYIGNFILPMWLTVDWDFPFSRTILDRGAIAGLVALVALCAAAWIYRRRFPLASFGFLAYLLLMAPTSSILPIRDPIADRRVYFSMLGLLLIVAEVVVRARIDRKVLSIVCAVVLAAAAGASYARAAIWGDATLLWEDTVRKSPNKARARFHLAFAYYEQQRYSDAVAEFEKAAALEPATYNMLVDWALAYDQLNKPAEALARLQQAAQMEPTAHVYSQIAMVHAKRSQWQPALDALGTAEKLDANFAPTYLYRGKIYLKTNMPAAAVTSYERALSLDPKLREAQQELLLARQMLAAQK